jgi:hypothetical protein
MPKPVVVEQTTSIGSPDRPNGQTVSTEKPTIQPGPVPSTPKRDGPTNPVRTSTGTTPDDNFMVVNKPK